MAVKKRASTTTASSSKATKVTPTNKSVAQLKLGKVVSITERVRWIEIPIKSFPKLNISHWPGIIYTSYNEFYRDIKVRNAYSARIQADMLLRERKRWQGNAKNKKDEFVLAVVCHGDNYSFCHFVDPVLVSKTKNQLSGEFHDEEGNDEDTRIQSYYEHYEEYTSQGNTQKSSKKVCPRINFQKAVHQMDSLLEEELKETKFDHFVVHAEYYECMDEEDGEDVDIVMKEQNMIISPDGSEEKELKSKKRKPKAARKTKGKKKSPARNISKDIAIEFMSEEYEKFSPQSDKAQDDDRDVLSFQSSQFSDTENSKHDEEEELVHDDVENEDNTKNKTPVPDTDNSEYSPIRAGEKWPRAWEKLKGQGWNWKFGSSLNPYRYFCPGVTGKDGSLGKDYLTHDEMENYARDTHGWGVSSKKRARSSQSCTEKQQKKSSSKQRIWGQGPSSKRAKRGSSNKVGKQQPETQLSAAQTINFLVKNHGWKCTAAKNLLSLSNWWYLKPGVKTVGKKILGEENVDYFTSDEALLEYVMENQHLLNTPESSPLEDISLVAKRKGDAKAVMSNLESAFDSSNSCETDSQEFHTPTNDTNHPSDTDEFDDESDGNESIWWLNFTIPSFTTDVWNSLKKIVNYSSGNYRVKSKGKTHKFERVSDMRTFLAADGLEIGRDHNLKEEELVNISRWISIAHLPAKFNGKSLRPQDSLISLRSVPVLNSEEAWSLLCDEFDCSLSDGGQYYVPCVGQLLDPLSDTKILYFDSIEDLRKRIRSHGFKAKTKQNTNLVSLILWASQADVSPFILQGESVIKVTETNTSNLSKDNSMNMITVEDHSRLEDKEPAQNNEAKEKVNEQTHQDGINAETTNYDCASGKSDEEEPTKELSSEDNSRSVDKEFIGDSGTAEKPDGTRVTENDQIVAESTTITESRLTDGNCSEDMEQNRLDGTNSYLKDDTSKKVDYTPAAEEGQITTNEVDQTSTDPNSRSVDKEFIGDSGTAEKPDGTHVTENDQIVAESTTITESCLTDSNCSEDMEQNRLDGTNSYLKDDTSKKVDCTPAAEEGQITTNEVNQTSTDVNAVMENGDMESTVKDVIEVKVTESKGTHNNAEEMTEALNVQQSSKIVHTEPIRNEEITKKVDDICVKNALLNTSKNETKFYETTNIDEGKSIQEERVQEKRKLGEMESVLEKLDEPVADDETKAVEKNNNCQIVEVSPQSNLLHNQDDNTSSKEVGIERESNESQFFFDTMDHEDNDDQSDTQPGALLTQTPDFMQGFEQNDILDKVFGGES